jgi:uncharacterized RDD family membrane protein YckC
MNQKSPTFTLASPHKRFAAFFIDILTLLPFWIFLPSNFPELYGVDNYQPNLAFFDIMYYFDILLMGLYFVYMMSKFQTTIGGMVMKIKIVKEDGSRATTADIILRELASGLSFIVLCIGYLRMFWHPRKQTWHDTLSKTVVIES